MFVSNHDVTLELNSAIFDATEKLRIEFPNLIAIQFIFDAPYLITS